MASNKEIERIIDASFGQTPSPTINEYLDFVKKAVEFDFAAVLVEPYYIKQLAPVIHEKNRKLVTVLSYPLATMVSKAKYFQAKRAIDDGADELDVAMNIHMFKDGLYSKVVDDLKPIVDMAGDRITKMLYYSNSLTKDEQLKAAEMAIKMGFKFLKTNPGFGYSTLPEDVKLIKDHFGDQIKVMASGSVRSREDAEVMIEMGTDRIATSTAFKMIGVE